jgi:hypothetical protein
MLLEAAGTPPSILGEEKGRGQAPPLPQTGGIRPPLARPMMVPPSGK